MSRRSDEITAAEADWGFTEDPALMAAIGKEAKRAAARSGLDPDDLEQEFYLWLAAPNKHGKSRWRGLTPGLVVNKLRSVTQSEREKSWRREGLEVELHAEN